MRRHEDNHGTIGAGETLVLAAHGSADDPRCAAPVLRHAATIAARGVFAQVLCVFWKQPPYFRQTLELTAAARVTVVPLLTAQGYYARTVLPRELGLDDLPAGRDVVLAPALGLRGEMADLIVAQGRDAAEAAGIEPGDAHLLVVGHGTPRDPVNSGASTWQHVGTIRQRAVFAGVEGAFLEQDPRIDPALAAIPGERPVVIVPNLIASGGHAVDDIPADLGQPAGTRDARLDGRQVIFAEAVGERPECAELIVRAALETRRARMTRHECHEEVHG